MNSRLVKITLQFLTVDYAIDSLLSSEVDWNHHRNRSLFRAGLQTWTCDGVLGLESHRIPERGLEDWSRSLECCLIMYYRRDSNKLVGVADLVDCPRSIAADLKSNNK